MTWSPILPTIRPSRSTAAVTVTVERPSERYTPCLSLVIRPALLANLPTWCKPGNAVTVNRGYGEHDGMVRLTPGGPWVLGTSGGTSGSIRLRLPIPPGAPADGHEAMRVEHDYAADWLEVTLPAWAVTPTVLQTTPTVRPPAAPPGKHVSIMDRVNDRSLTIAREQDAAKRAGVTNLPAARGVS